MAVLQSVLVNGDSYSVKPQDLHTYVIRDNVGAAEHIREAHLAHVKKMLPRCKWH